MNSNDLNTVLIDNLIDPEEFKRNPSKITMLECFHFNIPASPRFNCFPALKEIRIIEQDITNLQFLEDLPNLEKLHVYHTQLSNTEGLKFCPKLRAVILEGNKLKEFPDISQTLNIELLSVAENPIEKSPIFTEHEQLKELNIAACHLSEIPPSIKKLQKLEILNISANHIHSFKALDIISKMPTLKELYLDDPNYGPNPVCSMPNYDIAIGCMMQQVDVVDTYTVNKKFRQVCESRKCESKIYYQTISALDTKECEQKRSDFYYQYGKHMSDLLPTCGLDKEKLAQIEKICFEFEHNNKESKKISAELPMISYKSIGLIRSTKLIEGFQEWDDFNVSLASKIEKSDERKVTALWEVSNLGAEVFVGKNENTPRNPKFVLFNSADDTLSAIESWTERIHEYQSSIPNCREASFVVSCNTIEVDGTLESYPEHLFMLSIPVESQLKEIEELCRQMSKASSMINEESSPETLCVLQRSYTLSETLVNVTLVDCGLTSLSALSNLPNMKTLNVMFNKIESIRDLPVFPSLESLDLSFNLISEVIDLLPTNEEAKGSIKEVSIIGNPVFAPTTQALVNEIFGKEKKGKILYSPPNDDSFFLTSIANKAAITYIDVSSNCLTTLKPLAKLNNLTKLIASNNQLREFDLASQALKYVDVSSNFISELPIQGSVPSLQFLLITNNNIKQLTQLNSILALFVSSNEIEAIPDASFYPNIIVLCMENNPIMDEIDQNRLLYQYKTLKILNGKPIKQSQHNKVQNSLNGILFAEELRSILSPGQTALKLEEKGYKDVNVLASDSIQTLSLKNNSISDIKWGKNAFPKLLQLDMSSNSLQNLDFLQSLQLLRSLNLSFNKIGDSLMKQLSATRLPNLKQLILSNNTIKTIVVGTFSHQCFPSLEILDISHNYVMQIERGSFAESNIISIDISYNSLKKLDGLNIQSLTHLDVSHNRITTVDEVEKLRSCANLTHFCFNDNPLNQRTIPRIRCLCILRNLKEMDGKTVTENDLVQVRQILEQQGMGLSQPEQTSQPGRTNKITNIIMSPNLPSLHEAQMQGQSKRRNERQVSRFPR